jgi:two-component system chemotaxis response regulator CheB
VTGRPHAEAVAIGASAGALEALSRVLPALPGDYPLPVFVVVHLPAEGESLLPDLLGRACSLPVREAEDKEPIRAGTVYLAPPDYHLLVERDGRLSLAADEPVQHARPSIDVLFESAADAYGPGLVGVVLTGANADGARGLKAVVAAGGVALVQHPGSSQAQAMPRAALAACPDALALDLAGIAQYLAEAARPAGP